MAELRTDTITDSAGTGTPDFSQGLSVSKAAASPPATDTIYKDNICRAWVNLDGTGTIAINDSFNVSSITDDNTGLYTITWDLDFADANYASVGMCQDDLLIGINTQAAGSTTVATRDHSSVRSDAINVCVVAFGDQ